ncbi:arsenite methyltransferase [Marinilabilia salmonicolor]|jgi:SAM-dependent methyltransferase|uniref:Arsenite methyltransferase n=1 Tax=Marinilabilia salmonicolor TaxID=989 RepID=A0A368VIT4_9BACT|nr:arsenite methyltransferase [Marinilabilia salmonicolor]RCW38921.1 methyltransferase family protein [Marinilabilia salmonicolor]
MTEIKKIVKDKYSAIANKSLLAEPTFGCCSNSCCGELEVSMIGDEYQNVKGYFSDADLGLGCGLPTEFAQIKEGDHVLDLGSGAGNDCFVARTQTGDSGRVTGLDFTEAMIQKAYENLKKTGFKNIEFVQGEIEEMPFPDSSFDVVISNCVLNLVPDKQKAFSEIFRVLKPFGHFSISDVVISGDLPEGLKKDAEMYAGCVSGAICKKEYISIVKRQGFSGITVQKEKEIVLSDEVLLNHISADELETFKQSASGIFSITLYAEK